MDRHEPRTTYEGRPLPRPDDELVDQGLGFDLGTMLNRRRLLYAAGISLAGLGLAACGADQRPSAGSSASSSATAGGGATTASGEIPEETAGPYPGNGSNGPDVLNQSGVLRSDLRTSFNGSSGVAEGVPMTLELTIQDLANGGGLFAGAAVYVWHCDREARYSMYSDGVTDQNYLRGVQIADATGTVRFISIFPACYAGRWPHVHFEVYRDQSAITDAATAIATSQVALPEAACAAVYAQPGYEQSVRNLSQTSLASDNVFGDDRAVTQLGTATGDATNGFAVFLAVGVDTRTAPANAGPGGAPSR